MPQRAVIAPRLLEALDEVARRMTSRWHNYLQAHLPTTWQAVVAHLVGSTLHQARQEPVAQGVLLWLSLPEPLCLGTTQMLASMVRMVVTHPETTITATVVAGAGAHSSAWPTRSRCLARARLSRPRRDQALLAVQAPAGMERQAGSFWPIFPACPATHLHDAARRRLRLRCCALAWIWDRGGRLCT